MPEPLGTDSQGREIISYIKGDVCNYPLSGAAVSETALVSAAKLLRDYHDASQSFLTSSCKTASWQLPKQEPMEVLCHGDVAPYNVVLKGSQAVGIIDFDTVHPGPRVWDLAYALYHWCPFTNPKNQDGFGTIDEQITRALLFCNEYGLPEQGRKKLALAMIKRLDCAWLSLCANKRRAETLILQPILPMDITLHTWRILNISRDINGELSLAWLTESARVLKST